jgi:hypothetical protein
MLCSHVLASCRAVLCRVTLCAWLANTQVGKFYEAAGVDAIMLHEYCGINFMGTVGNLQVRVQQSSELGDPHAGRPASGGIFACLLKLLMPENESCIAASIH